MWPVTFSSGAAAAVGSPERLCSRPRRTSSGTPLKEACLSKCRTPLGLMLGSWRPGRSGGFRLGAASGAWCAGCCWALMTSLFALGVMSIAWTALVAAIVGVEKTLPWRRVATAGTAGLLLALGLLLLVAPDRVPLLTLPGSGAMPMGG
jgi:hypothetical protein